MANIVEIKDVSKTYRSKRALSHVSLELKNGRVMGILGPNGSGKTTLIKLLAGFLNPTTGTINISGDKPGVKSKAKVSYLPDRNFMFKDFTIEQALQLYVDFFEDFNYEKALDMLTFMKLSPEMRIDELSKGMTEKLHLTLVLCRDAQLFILDEPIAGVDPVARDQILDAIIRNVEEDSTMLITTHLVRDMERIFDDVAFISEGEVILQGEAEELRHKKGMSIDDLYKDIFG